MFIYSVYFMYILYINVHVHYCMCVCVYIYNIYNVYIYQIYIYIYIYIYIHTHTNYQNGEGKKLRSLEFHVNLRYNFILHRTNWLYGCNEIVSFSSTESVRGVLVPRFAEGFNKTLLGIRLVSQKSKTNLILENIMSSAKYFSRDNHSKRFVTY